jgi:hypothetical protein
VTFFVIGFGAWLVSGGRRYREEYASSTQGWRIGSTQTVEITLVRQDRQNLSCASDHEVDGLHCGFRGDMHSAVPGGADDPHILQPFNTVRDELLLGAGMWTAPDLKGALPLQRFSVICEYNVKGFLRSAAIRFDPTVAFVPVGRIATVGTLTNCVLPR